MLRVRMGRGDFVNRMNADDVHLIIEALENKRVFYEAEAGRSKKRFDHAASAALNTVAMTYRDAMIVIRKLEAAHNE